MKVLDPGHSFQLNTIDGDIELILQFVKREGEGYPGNVGHYPGTQIQEVLRACIARIKYVDRQIPHPTNLTVLTYLRACIELLEIRAAERHHKKLDLTEAEDEIEYLPVGKNGHLLCGAGSE